MNNHKLWLACCVLAVLALVGCDGKKDKNYYQKHIYEARKKAYECYEERRVAMASLDFAKVRLLMKDEECNTTTNVLNQYIEAEKFKEKISIKAELDQLFSDLTWQQKIAAYANHQCASNDSNKDKQDINCLAWKQFYDEQVQIGTNQLSQYQYYELAFQTDYYCQPDHQQISACTVFSNVAKDKELVVVDEYLHNREALKKSYNLCIDTINELKKFALAGEDDIEEDISRVKQGYPCKQAKMARDKLNLGDDDFNKKF